MHDHAHEEGGDSTAAVGRGPHGCWVWRRPRTRLPWTDVVAYYSQSSRERRNIRYQLGRIVGVLGHAMLTTRPTPLHALPFLVPSPARAIGRPMMMSGDLTPFCKHSEPHNPSRCDPVLLEVG